MDSLDILEQEKYLLFDRVSEDLGIEISTEQDLIELLHNFEIV